MTASGSGDFVEHVFDIEEDKRAWVGVLKWVGKVLLGLKVGEVRGKGETVGNSDAKLSIGEEEISDDSSEVSKDDGAGESTVGGADSNGAESCTVGGGLVKCNVVGASEDIVESRWEVGVSNEVDDAFESGEVWLGGFVGGGSAGVERVGFEKVCVVGEWARCGAFLDTVEREADVLVADGDWRWGGASEAWFGGWRGEVSWWWVELAQVLLEVWV